MLEGWGTVPRPIIASGIDTLYHFSIPIVFFRDFFVYTKLELPLTRLYIHYWITIQLPFVHFQESVVLWHR